MCNEHGITETILTGGDQKFMSGHFQQLLTIYGIHHRVSAAYNPHTNCRPEIAVILIERLIRDNVSLFGNLDTAKVTKTLLQHRNTPGQDTGLSPA